MPTKTVHLLVMLSTSFCMAASAENCAPPPGTVGIGKYCAKDSSATTIPQTAPNTIPAASAALPPEPNTKAGATTSPADASAAALRVRTPGATIRTWTILPTDGRLSITFERWAKADGMKLVWDAQQHVMLSSSDSFTGTLTEALTRVMTSPAIRLSPYPLEACIYPNNPPLLRITRAGEQSLECPQ